MARRTVSKEESGYNRQPEEAEGKEKTDLISRLVSFMSDVEEQTGPIGRQLIEQYSRGELSPAQLKEQLDEAPDFREFQDKALEFLELLGVVEYAKGQIIVDLDKIAVLPIDAVRYSPKNGYGNTKSYNYFRRKLGKFDKDQAREKSKVLTRKFEAYFGEDITAFLFNAFHGKNVISKADWQAWQDGGKKVKCPKQSRFFIRPKALMPPLIQRK